MGVHKPTPIMSTLVNGIAGSVNTKLVVKTGPERETLGKPFSSNLDEQKNSAFSFGVAHLFRSQGLNRML